MIRPFFDWWVEQLRDLQPEWLRRWIAAPADGLLITPLEPLERNPDTVSIEVRRRGTEAAIGEFRVNSPQLETLPRPRGAATVLRLPPMDVLEKSVDFPLAAQGQLDQVLEFEMDRQTPFAADELYWDYRIAAIDRQRGRMTVSLAMVLRRNLDPLLSALERVGLVPTRVELLGGRLAGSLISLGRGHSRREPRRLIWVLATGCALLALAAAAAPFVRQSLALARLDREIADARPAAAAADKLRQEIDRLSSNAAFIADERSRAVSALNALAAVTRLLPDGTFLTALELRQKKLSMTGRSASAAPLIATLAADPQFQNPVFSAPVTRLEAGQGEVFSITAVIQ